MSIDKLFISLQCDGESEDEQVSEVSFILFQNMFARTDDIFPIDLKIPKISY
jgi:hypothetical protein